MAIIAIVGGLATAITLLAVLCAKDGYEDETGFHPGAPPVPSDLDYRPTSRRRSARRLPGRFILKRLGFSGDNPS